MQATSKQESAPINTIYGHDQGHPDAAPPVAGLQLRCMAHTRIRADASQQAGNRVGEQIGPDGVEYIET